MPAQEFSGRTTPLVVWPFIEWADDGQPLVGDPIEIMVRSEGREENLADSDGAEIEIITADDIVIGSMVWIGRLADWDGVRPEESTFDVFRISEVMKTPDIKGRVTLTVVKGIRARSSWPNTGAVEKFDPELSALSVSKTTIVANGSDEVSITMLLRNGNGEPVEDRVVTMTLSESAGISLNNSPQITNVNGRAVFRLRATSPLTTSATFSTVEDGPIFGTISLLFT